jgi:hypothetical protein
LPRVVDGLSGRIGSFFVVLEHATDAEHLSATWWQQHGFAACTPVGGHHKDDALARHHFCVRADWKPNAHCLWSWEILNAISTEKRDFLQCLYSRRFELAAGGGFKLVHPLRVLPT